MIVGGALFGSLALPIMWSTATGSEIMKRIAVPMISGMISSTLLTPIVISAIFGIIKGIACRMVPIQLAVRRARPLRRHRPYARLSTNLRNEKEEPLRYQKISTSPTGGCNQIASPAELRKMEGI